MATRSVGVLRALMARTICVSVPLCGKIETGSEQGAHSMRRPHIRMPPIIRTAGSIARLLASRSATGCSHRQVIRQATAALLVAVAGQGTLHGRSAPQDDAQAFGASHGGVE
jgi:hypothetical protein